MIKKTLDLPTQPRNKEEEKLLDDIILDPSLQDLDLRKKVQDYMDHNHNYVLIAWFHPSAPMFRYSFENKVLATVTREYYNNQKPVPKIVGIRGYEDLNY